MPIYTLKDMKTAEVWEVQCSYDELQKTLDCMPDIIQVLSAPKIVSVIGNTVNKTPDGFKDLMGRIKSGSGKNNTIRS